MNKNVSQTGLRYATATLALVASISLTGCGGGSSSESMPPTNPPGSLDTSFGTGGTVTTVGLFANATVVQPDGKILVVGAAAQKGISAPTPFLVMRYNNDGTPDSAFGAGGIVLTSPVKYNAEAWGVALQPDGRIVVAGPFDGGCALVRYTADGALDASFGNGGIVTAGVNDCRAVALQPDGKLVAAFSGGNEMGALRFNANGTPDSSFGAGGRAHIPCCSSATATSIAIQSDGKVLIAGSATVLSSETILARFDSAGAIDLTFGQAGLIHAGPALAPAGAPRVAIALQRDGKIVATNSAAVLRFMPDGAADATFGVAGSTAALSGSPFAIQLDGSKIVVGGEDSTARAFKLWRIDADGALDPGFGNDGSVVTQIGTYSTITGLAIQPDGRIVAVGYAGTPNVTESVAIARYFGG